MIQAIKARTRKISKMIRLARLDLAPRLRDKKILFGVCAGISKEYRLPVAFIRALFIMLSFPFGLGILAYFLLVLISPVR